MRSRTVRAVALAATSALIGLVGVGASASAAEPDPAVPAEPAAVAEVLAVPSTFTLPLFGPPLTIDITTGPGGTLASVMINPADGFTATKVKPNKVAFVNEDGTAKVVVKARSGGQRVEAKAGSLGDLVGPGGWAGEIFPGLPATVAFNIADKGDGSPDITGITVAPIAGVTVEIGAVNYSNDDDDEQEASVRIKFIMGDQSRWLSIKAEVETEDDDDDGDSHAKVRVTLSKIRNAPLVGADAVGPQRWSGVLCSGAPVSIDYVVSAEGVISDVVILPEPTDQRIESDRIEVRFADGERIRIKVGDHDGELVVRSGDKIRCRDAADPTVNVPVVTNDDHHDKDDDGDHSGRGGDDDDDDDGDGHRGGRGGDDDDDDDGDDDNDDDDDDDQTSTTVNTTLDNTVTTVAADG